MSGWSGPSRGPGLRATGRRGLTLVEVLVTLVLIVSAIAAIFVVLQTATRRSYRAGEETLATIYASDIMEAIRGAPYGAFPANGQDMTPRQVFQEHNIPESSDLATYDEQFSILARVSPVEPYDPSEMKKIEVVVSWESRPAGTPKNATLVTFYRPSK